MDKQNLYEHRDCALLDEDGGHYVKHVHAMTAEGLYGKSEIAAELAYRDHKIAKLKASLDRCQAGVRKYNASAVEKIAELEFAGETCVVEGIAREADLQASREEVMRLEATLREIQVLGHSTGHGKGYTCATMAKQALED